MVQLYPILSRKFSQSYRAYVLHLDIEFSNAPIRRNHGFG